MKPPAIDPAGGRGLALSAPARGSAFDQLVRSLDSQQESRRKVDSADPASLLVLQAAVYEEARRIEIATRVLEQGIGAVKTILQTRL